MNINTFTFIIPKRSLLNTMLIFALTVVSLGFSFKSNGQGLDMKGPGIALTPINPVCCPADIYVSCLDYCWDPNAYGNPYFYPGYCGHISEPVVCEYLNCCGIGYITRTWTITLCSGYTTTCTQRITIFNSNPLNPNYIQWPADYTINGCSGDIDPNHIPKPYNKPVITQTGPCSSIGISYKDWVFEFDGGCKKIMRTWTVIDFCTYEPNNPFTGGIWTKVQWIFIMNNEKPTLKCPDDIITSVTDNSCTGGYVKIPIPEAFDNCGSVTVKHDSKYAVYSGADASGFYPLGTTYVTFTASNGCGGKVSCTIRVIVKDIKKPSPICLGTVHVVLMGMPSGAMLELRPNLVDWASFDNCTPRNKLKFWMEPAIVTCANLGENEVKMWVEDESGNRDYCISTVDVQDNMGNCPPDTVAPTITCSNVEVVMPTGNCDSMYVAVPLPNATHTHNFKVTNNSPYAKAGGKDASGVYPVGTTTIVYTAKSYSGLESTCEATVTVRDTTKPLALCNQNVVINIAVDTSTTIPLALIKTELIDKGSGSLCPNNPVTLSIIPQGYDCGELGEHQVTLTVVDKYGNSDFCIATVIVEDPDDICSGNLLNPIVDCLNDISINVDSTNCTGTDVSVPDLVIKDSAATQSIFNNSPFAQSDGINASGFYPVGKTKVTYTAKDTAGNVYTCRTNIWVKEPIAPVVSCKNDFTFKIGQSGGLFSPGLHLSPIDLDNGSYDNCTKKEDLEFSLDRTDFDCSQLGKQLIKLVVTDQSGNSDYCLTYINVTDSDSLCNPSSGNSMVCPDDVVIFTDKCESQYIKLSQVVGVDGSSAVTNNSKFADSKGNDASGTYPIGTTTVTYTFTDNKGNTSTCQQKVSLKEKEEPVASCNHDVTFNMQIQLSTQLPIAIMDPKLINRASSDNCTPTDKLRFTVEPSTFDCEKLGKQQVKLVVKDQSGNTDYCITYVNITDTKSLCTGFNGNGTNSMSSDGKSVDNRSLPVSAFNTDLKALPNPFNNEATIRFNLDQTEGVKLMITDMTGRLVKTFNNGFVKGNNNIEISGSDLPAKGIYFIKLEGKAISQVTRLVYIQ